MPCPHFRITVVQRSKRQSAVAGAAYQSGEKLFSEYDQKVKNYSEKRGIEYSEIMIPSNVPPEYTDRGTLWNSVEKKENQWNSQLARRIILAIPRELPKEQRADLLRDFCNEHFVSEGMIVDFAIHDKGNGNPHAHILLTMRAMDECGRWLAKSRKVYDLDDNGERIRLPSGEWKSHKADVVDWNDQKYGEIWRHGWEVFANRYLEMNNRAERLDLRSYARQGLDKIPTVHMGPEATQMERKGFQTNKGNLNREIAEVNKLTAAIRKTIASLKRWLTEIKEQLASAIKEQQKEQTLPELLIKYLSVRKGERSEWSRYAQNKGMAIDLKKVSHAIAYLQKNHIATIVSAPVIKCKKTPVKKCRFATERNVIWYTRNRLNGERRKGCQNGRSKLDGYPKRPAKRTELYRNSAQIPH